MIATQEMTLDMDKTRDDKDITDDGGGHEIHARQMMKNYEDTNDDL